MADPSENKLTVGMTVPYAHLAPLIRISVVEAQNASGKTKWELSPYDGHAEFLIRSMDDISKAMQDPYFEKMVKPDEEMFSDPDGVVVMVGYEEVVIEDGKVVVSGSNKPKAADM